MSHNPPMAGSKVWGKWGNTLAVAVEADFARKAGSLLRILYPDLISTPDRQRWDAAGIDYLCWVDQGTFPCVVQCKGFHVQELGEAQVRQIRDSIESFIDSDASCGEYLLVHNRDGRFKPFNNEVSLLLKEMITRGKAKRARLLDRHTLLNETKRVLTARIEEDIRNASATRRKQIAALFSFELPYLTEVPVREGSIELQRDTPSRVALSTIDRRLNVSHQLVRGSNRGWTLLEGMFGVGKTTTAFEAASSHDRTVIVLQCSQIPPAATQSLRKALEGSANLDLDFVQFEDDRLLIEELAASVLVQLLSAHAAPERYLLIVDGLDENRIFSSLPGLQALVNQLADLECGVVLTARSEHFNALFGNYSAALSELSWKYGKSQKIDLLQLQPWSRSDIIAFLETAIQDAPATASEALRSLREMLVSSAEASTYGDIPSNPLLLRFLIDDVVSEGLRVRSRGSLLRAWARRKFWRDAEKRSSALPPGQDLTTFVDRIYEITESIAGAMVQSDGQNHQLVETISSEAIEPLLELLDAAGQDQVLSLLLHSVLVPVSHRKGRSIEIRFAFRLFQEFFLASYLNRENRASAGFPDSVRDLCADLSALDV